MLFNSYLFIFVFLPLVLLLFHGLRQFNYDRTALFILVVMSLIFYAWWNPMYLLLLLPLMFINYQIANAIENKRQQSQVHLARVLLFLGIGINLAALGYFKYANFFVDNVNELFGSQLFLATIILPLGISFFTFQKIALLVDIYKGKVGRLDPLDFSLFVVFFPQLIAGPIVHHSEMMPQFRQIRSLKNQRHQQAHNGRMTSWITLGMSIFFIGLAKKVLLADTAADYASPLFNGVALGMQVDFIAAWAAALAYTAQLYFDFSAYSDMAIGIALMFGIHLPLNFASPYKAVNIIDFWRRWHMTLSRFLRDYLYIPLGGNRSGSTRRYINIFLTMVLGGIWHGAGWTFIVWGMLHGVYLMINHGWHEIRRRAGFSGESSSLLSRRLSQLITFIAVVVAWVFFRAADMDVAISLLGAMIGNNGITIPASLAQLAPSLMPGWPVSHASIDGGLTLLVALSLLLLAWFAPNTQQITGYSGPAPAATNETIRPATHTQVISQSQIHNTPLKNGLRWNTSLSWALGIGGLFSLSLMFMSRVSEFIYFQF